MILVSGCMGFLFLPVTDSGPASLPGEVLSISSSDGFLDVSVKMDMNALPDPGSFSDVPGRIVRYSDPAPADATADHPEETIFAALPDDIGPEDIIRKEIGSFISDTIVSHAAEPANFGDPASAERSGAHQAWLDAHTYNASVTEIYQYDGGNMSCETIYRSEEFVGPFGTDTLHIVSDHFIETPDNVTLTLVLPTVEKRIVVTKQTEPFPAKEFGYDHPCYLWECYDGYAFLEDPVNLIWVNTDIESVRKTFLEEYPGWIGSGIIEKNYSVYDAGTDSWITGRSVADGAWRVEGGYHVRIYELSDGTVVAGAHKDCPAPHEAVQFEPFEEFIAGRSSGNGSWTVFPDRIYLGNENEEIYNNGYATLIVCGGQDGSVGAR